MTSEHLIVERNDAVAVVTVNRPKVLNVLKQLWSTRYMRHLVSSALPRPSEPSCLRAPEIALLSLVQTSVSSRDDSDRSTQLREAGTKTLRPYRARREACSRGN